jgi:hypothetical protein
MWNMPAIFCRCYWSRTTSRMLFFGEVERFEDTRQGRGP